MKKLLIMILAIAMLMGSCIAEELNQVWHYSHDTEQPETVYYPEFQFDIPDSWQVYYLRADGRTDIAIPGPDGHNSGRPDSTVLYIPYSQMWIGENAFTEDGIIPGTYEFRQIFTLDYLYGYIGGNQLDCVFRVKAGDRYGAAVCISQDGKGINHYNLRICKVIVPGDEGVFCMMAFVGGKENEVVAYAGDVCLKAVEGLRLNGENVEVIECSYPSYKVKSGTDYRSGAPAEWQLESSAGTEDPVFYDMPPKEISWKFKVGECTVEKKLFLADALENENVEFLADAENGVSVRINGFEQANRKLKGLENGGTEYVTLKDGTQAMIYTAVYETETRVWYFEGALFICTDGVAMPFISSQQPIPDGLLEDAMELYMK